MCPDREPRSFAEVRVTAATMPPRAVPSRVPLLIAGGAAWVLYAGAYALTFGLGGAPISVAIRAGLANGIPDGLLAIAAAAIARRTAASRASAPTPYAIGVAMVAAAAGAKVSLIWLDMAAHGQRFAVASSVVAWQVLTSGLVYVAVAAASHAWIAGQRLREEAAHAARADALRATAELAALRAQLNPHFLFNTLHSVMGLVRRDPALAETALERLGDLLRYAIRVHRDGVDWTRLRDEWEFVETYLALESIRLGERLRVERHIDEAALDRQVPTFCLQPLVENAVRHGIAPRAAGGTIAIDVRADRDGSRIEVANDGDGHASSTGEGGLGLKVLRDRLDGLYRGRAQITAGPAANGGYRVVLALPARPADPEAVE
jgi:two-component system LytT family sensor kinase